MRVRLGATWLALGGAVLAATSCGGKTTSRHTAEDGGSRAGGAGLPTDDAGASGMPAPPELCASIEASSVRRVEGLVFAIDRSTVMSEGWPDVSQALLDFLSDPSLPSLSAALRFFPDERPVPGCDATTCSAEACATPLVPLAELTSEPRARDPQEALLTDTIAHIATTSDEPPLDVALQGALAFAEAQHSPNLRMSVVLVTAAYSGACNLSPELVAARAYQEAGINTFVVAPAASGPLAELDALAFAGGTDTAIRVGPSDGTNPLAPLFPIASAAYTCALTVPAAPLGKSIDFGSAVMTVTLDSDPPFVAPLVPTASDCGSELGWYYDSNESPTMAEFCPALCSELTQNRNAHVVLSFPCQSG